MSARLHEISTPNGERMVFLQSAADTRGELLDIEAHYPPHSPMPPEHYHPSQHERFEIVRGVYRASIGGEERTYRAGDVFEIPAGIPHWMHNISDEPGQLRWQIRPALNTQAFFEIFFKLANEGKSTPKNPPNLLQLAVILDAYRGEFVATSPPLVVQRIVFGMLAPLGRMVGLKAR
jgi:mannose-6-phosphate isomerase-like protein (cupin superfamily)